MAHKISRKKLIEDRAKRNGFRHSIFTSTQVSRGEWKNNFKCGRTSVLFFKTQHLYEGEWVDGIKKGYGVLSKKKSDNSHELLYEGDWNGLVEGSGRRHYKDGSYYDGEWFQHKREGHGRMWFSQGAYYEGEWKVDKPHGLGLFVDVNGNRYEGEWLDGKKNGRGQYYHLDSGQVQDGVWNDGICVCSTLRDIQYRQSAIEPTQYPVQTIQLKEPDKVYGVEESNQIRRIGKVGTKQAIEDQ